MIPVRIVFSDVDGTLLDSGRTLSIRTRAEISRLAKLNIPFILASSRMPKAMRPLLDACNVDFPLIAYNGALVLSEMGADRRERVLFTQTLSFKVLFAVAAFWTDSPIHMSVYRNNEWFSEDEDEWLERERNNTRVEPAVLPMATLVEMWQLRQMGPHKILCMGDPEELTILQVLLAQQFTSEVILYRSKETYLEISPANASKESGARIVLNHYDLEFSLAAAFGNHDNDIGLVAKAAHGYAVENSSEALKKAARRFAPPSTGDGVAITLKKLIP